MTSQQQKNTTIRIPGYHSQQDTRHIIWLEGSGNYTILHSQHSHRPLLIAQTLKYFEQLLPDFIRASKSSLINPDYVDLILKENSRTLFLQLANGITVALPRRRVKALMLRMTVDMQVPIVELKAVTRKKIYPSLTATVLNNPQHGD